MCINCLYKLADCQEPIVQTGRKRELISEVLWSNLTFLPWRFDSEHKVWFTVRPAYCSTLVKVIWGFVKTYCVGAYFLRHTKVSLVFVTVYERLMSNSLHCYWYLCPPRTRKLKWVELVTGWDIGRNLTAINNSGCLGNFMKWLTSDPLVLSCSVCLKMEVRLARGCPVFCLCEPVL